VVKEYWRNATLHAVQLFTTEWSFSLQASFYPVAVKTAGTWGSVGHWTSPA